MSDLMRYLIMVVGSLIILACTLRLVYLIFIVPILNEISDLRHKLKATDQFGQTTRRCVEIDRRYSNKRFNILQGIKKDTPNG